MFTLKFIKFQSFLQSSVFLGLEITFTFALVTEKRRILTLPFFLYTVSQGLDGTSPKDRPGPRAARCQAQVDLRSKSVIAEP